MKKVLLDINILLDVLQRRPRHYEASAAVLSLSAESKIEAYVSAPSFGILHYIYLKHSSKSHCLQSLKKLRALIRVAAVDERVIDLALDADFADLEDAIQYYCAIRSGLQAIITRNQKDFKKAKLPVLHPEEFLLLYHQG